MSSMQSKSLKIFIGPTEIANIAAILAGAFKEMGIRVTVVCLRAGPFQDGMKYDKVLDLKQAQGIFKYPGYFLEFFLRHCYYLRFFLQHNVFIFLAGSSLLPYNLDLVIYRLFRKKTIMWFVGSDIRDYDSVEAAIKKMGIKHRHSEALRDSPRLVKYKKRRIRMVEKYVDYIISYPSISQLLTTEYIGKEMASRIYAPIDVGSIGYNNIPNKRPLVVHAPSYGERKGTPFVVEAVERL